MSIREVEKNKKYRIEVVIGYNGDKKIRHYETFTGGKREAVLRENEIKLQIQTHTYIKKNDMTIKELIEEWLKSKKGNVGIKTYQEYERECRNVIDSIGHIKLKNINAKILEDFYNQLKIAKGRGRSKEGYSDKTIKHYYALISDILNKAVKWDYIPSNPNNKVTPIKVRKKEISCYTPAEVKELFRVLKNEPIKYQAVIFLAIDSGARMGEITGLTWKDIDFEELSVNINKATQYVAGYGTFEKDTKSETSNRKIYVSKTTMQVLKKYKVEQDKLKMQLGSKWAGSERVFTTELGEDMHPHRPYKILQQIIKKYNLKKVTFHSLRHTSISLLSSLGVPLQQISRRAGHSSITITDEVYSHIFEKDKQEIGYKMDTLLNANVI